MPDLIVIVTALNASIPQYAELSFTYQNQRIAFPDGFTRDNTIVVAVGLLYDENDGRWYFEYDSISHIVTVDKDGITYPRAIPQAASVAKVAIMHR